MEANKQRPSVDLATATAMATNDQSPKTNRKLESTLFSDNDPMAKIVDKNGGIDARAFKSMIFEKQAGSMTGPKNSLAVAKTSGNKNEFLQDNILLHGLKTFGITIEELLEANMRNMNPRAFEGINKRFKTQEEFVRHVEENLQSPVVRSLKSIVNVVKPKQYGLGSDARSRSLPSNHNRSKASFLTSQGGAISASKVGALSSRLETVTEENQTTLGKVNTFASLEETKAALTFGAGGVGQQQSPLEPLQVISEAIEVDSQTDANKSTMMQPRQFLHAKNASVPRLKPAGASLMPSQLQVDSHMNSQMAIHQRSSPMQRDISLEDALNNVYDELNKKIVESEHENERFARNTSPFKNSQDFNVIQPARSTVAVMMPKTPPLSTDDPNAPTRDEYHELYQRLMHKYVKKPRNGKPISSDPYEVNKLMQKGYQIKAERYQMKREKKKLVKQRSVVGEENALVRGDPGYISSESSSATSHSSVSYGGVPEADLEYLVDDDKMNEINDRRNQRRSDKWQVIFDSVVSRDVKHQISQAILSDNANYEGSDVAVAEPGSFAGLQSTTNLDSGSGLQTVSQQSESSPTTKRRRFADHQADMAVVMNKIAERLKGRFLEDIDEEIPEEYLTQKEQTLQQSLQQTTTTFRSTSTGHDSLNQIESNIQRMISELKSDIKRDTMEEDSCYPADTETGNHKEQQQQDSATLRKATKASLITKQGSYISGRHQMAHRLNKFNKDQNTSPKFYDNEQEENNWKAKMRALQAGKIESIFPKGLKRSRMESLQKLAQHLQSKNLLHTESVGNIPKGFNQKRPLDPVTLSLGQHIFERTENKRQQRFEQSGHGSSISGAAGGMKQSHSKRSSYINQQEASYSRSPIYGTKLLNNNNSSMMMSMPQMHIHSTIQSDSQRNTFSKRNSDQLLSQMNAVFTYFAVQQKQGGVDLLDSNSQQSLSMSKNQEAVIEGVKVPLPRDRSRLSEDTRGTPTPPICMCNHLTPHRHFFMKPIPKVHVSSTQTVENRVEVIQPVQATQTMPFNGALINPTSEVQSTEQILTPGQLMISDRMQYDDISEPPAKFSANQSKSNADIIEDLANFRHLSNHNDLIHEVNDQQQDGSTVEDQEDENKSTREVIFQQPQQIKTFTILNKNPILGGSSRNDQRDDSNQMVRDNSKEDGVIMSPARYVNSRLSDAKQDQKKDPKQKAAGKAPRKTQVSIHQNLNHPPTTKHADTSTYEVDIIQSRNPNKNHQQLLSVSVTNIELPDQYKLSKNQMPTEIQQQKSTNLDTSTLRREPQQRLHEVGLQVNFTESKNMDSTQKSFFGPPKHATPDHTQMIIVDSAMSMAQADNQSSRPTIKVESSQVKIATLGLTPASQSAESERPIALNSSINKHVILPQLNSQESSPRFVTNPAADYIQMQNHEQTFGNSSANAKQISRDVSKMIIAQQANNNSNLSPRASELAGKVDAMANAIKVQRVGGPMQQQRVVFDTKKQYQEQSSPTRSNLQYHLGVGVKTETSSKFEINSPIMQPIHNQDDDTEGTVYQREHSKLKNSRQNVNRTYPVKSGKQGTGGGGSNEDLYQLTNQQFEAVPANKQPQQEERAVKTKDLTGFKLADMHKRDVFKTDRVVRNFKPSRPKKTTDASKNIETKKLSQLADSNVTPLGLFNQDLHAKREWNKLMEQKNFSETWQERHMTFQDGPLNDFLQAHVQTEANKTATEIPHSPNKAVELLKSTGSVFDPSAIERDRIEQSTLQGDTMGPLFNNTLMVEQPRIHVLNNNEPIDFRKKATPNKKSVAVPTKVPQARQGGKVIVFNFQSNNEISEEMRDRLAHEQKLQQQKLSLSLNKRPLNNLNSSQNHGIFSPKRNSSVVHTDSVSIYAQAKAALGQESVLSPSMGGGVERQLGQQSSRHDGFDIKEERTRYCTTVRQRKQSQSNQAPPLQPTSLSTSKFLASRRGNPISNQQVFTTNKVSPFKPIGGGFKQNLNVEVSPERLEKQIALYKENASNQFVGATRQRQQSKQMSTLNIVQNNDDVTGLNIARAKFNTKKINNQIAEKLMAGSEDNNLDNGDGDVVSAKRDKSVLSNMNEALLDHLRASEDGNESSESENHVPHTLEKKHKSLDKLAKRTSNNRSLNSTGNDLSEVQFTKSGNFKVPRDALYGKASHKEAIQTNESFANDINNTPLTKQSPLLTPSMAVQTGNTFAGKKKSTGVPYPIKTGVLGDSGQILNRTAQTGTPYMTKLANFTTKGSQLAKGHLGSLDHRSNKSKSPPRPGELKVGLASKKLKSPTVLFETQSTTPNLQNNISTLTKDSIKDSIKVLKHEMVVKEQLDSIDNQTESAERLSLIYGNQTTASRQEVGRVIQSTSGGGQTMGDTVPATATAANRETNHYFTGLTKSPDSRLSGQQNQSSSNLTAANLLAINLNQGDVRTVQRKSQRSLALQQAADWKIDAERTISNIVNANNSSTLAVAGLQLGSQNYRKKAKKQKGEGLRSNFEFQNDHAVESLNRILGTVRERSKNRNLLTVNINQSKQLTANAAGVGNLGAVNDSRGTDKLLNISNQNYDMDLIIGSNAAPLNQSTKATRKQM